MSAAAEPPAKRVKLASPRFTATVIVVYDFEARGDVGTVGSAKLNGLETLASIGASVFVVKYELDESSSDVNDASASAVIKSAVIEIPVAMGTLRTFYDVFPTTLSDEEWSKMPLTATKFWQNNQQAWKALREGGHKQVSAKQHAAYMKQSALQFAIWLDRVKNWVSSICRCEKVSMVMATDTASSDSKRLASYLTAAEVWSPPYDFGGKYNGTREWDYSQLASGVRLTGKPNEPDFRAKPSPFVPVERNHIASADAESQTYEALWTLLWACTTIEEFEVLKTHLAAGRLQNPKTTGLSVALAASAQRVHDYFAHL